METLEKEETEEILEVLEDEEIERQIPTKDIARYIMEYLTAIMCAAIFILVPLYMKDKYFGIGTGKYEVYRNIMFICIPLLVCFAIWYLFCIRGEFKGGWLKEHLSIVDKAVLLYLLCVFISFFLSDFKAEAIWGYKGWYMGLVSQISFVLLYFFVSRFGRYGKELLVLLCCVSFVVYVLGILNRFLIDPLGVYIEIDAEYQIKFLSTLGQSSWYSSFLCTVLPVGIYFFWNADKRWKIVLSGIYCVIGFSSLVTQNSDSAYIALACILLALLCFSVKDGKKMTKFYCVTSFFLIATRLMNICAHFLNNRVIEQLDELSYFFIMSPLLWFFLAMNVLLLATHICVERKGKYHIGAGVVLRNIILVAMFVVLAVAIFCLYFSGTGKLPENIANITARLPYLSWKNSWGNFRGFTWRITWKMFFEMSLAKKIFGVGPECYPYYAHILHQDEIDAVFEGLMLTNAHNEWYNAVINYGVIGGAAYLAIFITGIKKFAKEASSESLCVCVVLVIVAYVGHNVFCYQQVLCTPFVFCVLGFSEWMRRKMKIV